MKRRNRCNALAPVDAPTWLAVFDEVHTPLSATPLPPKADPRAVLEAAMQAGMKDGWDPEEPPSDSFGGYFSRNGDARRLVMITQADPFKDSIVTRGPMPWRGTPAPAPQPPIPSNVMPLKPR